MLHLGFKVGACKWARLTTQSADVCQVKPTKCCTEPQCWGLSPLWIPSGFERMCAGVWKVTGWILTAVSTVFFFNEPLCSQLSQDHHRERRSLLCISNQSTNIMCLTRITKQEASYSVLSSHFILTTYYMCNHLGSKQSKNLMWKSIFFN